jgi:WD40 repeat protein
VIAPGTHPSDHAQHTSIRSLLAHCRTFNDTYIGNVSLGYGTGDSIFKVAWSPNGDLIAGGALNGHIRVWDVEAETLEWDLSGNDYQGSEWSLGAIDTVSFSPDGLKLQSVSGDGTIRRWNVITGQVLDTVSLGETVYASAFSSDGSRLAYAVSTNAPVIVYPFPPLNNLPFFDGFENGTGNWTISGAWTRTNAGKHSGSWSMRIVTPPFGNHNLILNETLNLAGTTAPQLTYWTRYTLAATQSAYVEVSTDNGATWTWLLMTTNSTKTQWTEKSVNLSAYAGQSIRLRFRLSYPYYPNLPQPEWWIDDVQVAETAP